MESYFAAKRRLFEMLPADAPAVINVDDPRGASLVEIVASPGDLRDQSRPPTSRRVRSSFALDGLDVRRARCRRASCT